MSKERFWILEDSTEFKLIRKIMWRRFPETAELLTNRLEQVDPFDLVHPGSPGEYRCCPRNDRPARPSQWGSGELSEYRQCLEPSRTAYVA